MGTKLRHMSLSLPESNLTFLSLIAISHSGIDSCDDVFAVVVLAYLVHIFLSSIRVCYLFSVLLGGFFPVGHSRLVGKNLDGPGV